MGGGDDDDDDGDDSDESGSEAGGSSRLQPPTVDLSFNLPSKYPDEKPAVKILDSQNLNESDIEELLNLLDRKSQESLGEVMIFTLVSDIVEWLSSKAERESNEIEEQKDRKREELEREEKKKCDGMPVTVESFLAWKAKFDAELLKAKIEQLKKEAEQNPGGAKRLTGREMFECDNALAESDMNFVEDLEQEQIEALMQNLDDVDLEDDEGDDEEELNSDDLDDEEDSDEEFGSDEELSDESEVKDKSKMKVKK